MTLKTLSLRAVVIATLLLAMNPVSLAMQHAFLVQNSGWMEPFYTDTNSVLRPLVVATIGVAADANDKVFVLSFNQSTPENASPVLQYAGSRTGDIRGAVEKISLARKGSGKALADTDFNEAIKNTISGPFKSGSGILWIFTNNKNSPNNSQETAARNREFYKLVHSEPAITRSLAFPLGMPVKGNAYSANGLMVYALAYGPEAGEYLKQMIASNRLGTVYQQRPAQLKPLDSESVRLVPKSPIATENATAQLAGDGRTVVMEIDVSNRPSVVRMPAGIENTFFPYRIQSGRVSAQFMTNSLQFPLPVEPVQLRALSPGQAMDVAVNVPMQFPLPDVWSPSSLFEFGRIVDIPAEIQIRVDDQRLELDPQFKALLEKLFPGDPLPEVFVPPATVNASMTKIPMFIRVHYPLYPLLVAMGALLGLLGGGGLLFGLSRAVASYDITVDGTPRRISVRRFSQAPIFSASGQQIGTVQRGFGAPTLTGVADGHLVSLRS